jgi:hypothetical protein
VSGPVYLDGVPYLVTTGPGEDPAMTVTVAQPTTPVVPVPERVLAVVGDSWSAVDWAPDGWPTQAAEAVGARLVNLAAGGSGYVRAAASSFPYAAAAQLPADASCVVVFGGYNDQELAAGDVEMAAHATYAGVRRSAPGAVLIVVGPQWPRWAVTEPPASYEDIRDAVRAAVWHAGARWVDPLAERWLAGHPELIGPDGHHPTPGAGQDYLAARIAPHVAAAMLTANDTEV